MSWRLALTHGGLFAITQHGNTKLLCKFYAVVEEDIVSTRCCSECGELQNDGFDTFVITDVENLFDTLFQISEKPKFFRNLVKLHLRIFKLKFKQPGELNVRDSKRIILWHIGKKPIGSGKFSYNGIQSKNVCQS